MLAFLLAAFIVAAPCIVIIAVCVGLSVAFRAYAQTVYECVYRWYRPPCLYNEARKRLRAECQELGRKFSKKSLKVLASLDVIEEDVNTLRHSMSLLDGEYLPIGSAYKFSRLVREKMCYPTRSKANRLAAVDHLRTFMEEACVRPHQRLTIMPLALEMVFMVDKAEAFSGCFRDMIAGTWREAKESTA